MFRVVGNTCEIDATRTIGFAHSMQVQSVRGVTFKEPNVVNVYLTMPPFYPWLGLFEESRSPTSMGFLFLAMWPLLTGLGALLASVSVLLIVSDFTLFCEYLGMDDSSNHKNGRFSLCVLGGIHSMRSLTLCSREPHPVNRFVKSNCSHLNSL